MGFFHIYHLIFTKDEFCPVLVWHCICFLKIKNIYSLTPHYINTAAHQFCSRLPFLLIWYKCDADLSCPELLWSPFRKQPSHKTFSGANRGALELSVCYFVWVLLLLLDEYYLAPAICYSWFSICSPSFATDTTFWDRSCKFISPSLKKEKKGKWKLFSCSSNVLMGTAVLAWKFRKN